MPNESIVFDPEVDKRALDKEAQAVDDRFEQSGQINPEIGEVQGELGLDGVGGIGGGGGGMGGGGMGGAGAGAGLASRIPKSISGVTAAAAMPVALAGGVGLGIMGAMHGASARLQTSTNLLGQAWNNVWRPLGDKVDQLFIRDIAQDLVSETQNFEESLRSGNWLKGAFELSTGLDISEASLGESIGTAAGNALSFGNPLMARVGGGIGQDIQDHLESQFNAASAELDQLMGGWPGWPDFSWPELPDFDWPSLPDFDWPNLPSFSWPEIGTPSWPSSSQILDEFPSLTPGSLRDAILGDGDSSGGGGGGGGGDNGGFFEGEIGDGFGQGPIFDGFQRGGVINRPTPVMAGESGPEIITPVAEFRRMMEGAAQQSGGGNSGNGGLSRSDLSYVEESLDRLNRNVKQLSAAMSDMNINVNGEKFGRLSSNMESERVTDTDPLI